MSTIRWPAPAFPNMEDQSGSADLSLEMSAYVAAFAGEAPSVHNTQPWRFSWDSKHFDVYADRDRRLNRIDPEARLLTISCGAAAHHAQLALRALGRAVRLELLPSADKPDHLARLTVEDIDSTAPTAGEWALLQAIGERGSYRSHFLRRLDGPLLDDLSEAVQGAGCRLYRSERIGQRDEVSRLVRHASAVLESDTSYYQELARWRRGDEAAADGIPRNALGPGRAAAAGTSFPPRDFGLDDRFGANMVFADADCASAPGISAVEPDVLAIWTLRDGPLDWLNAGRALSGLLLTVTCAGAAAGLLDQPLEDGAARRRLRAALGVGGPVQVLLRTGFPASGPNPTPRRAVRDTLA